MEASATKALNPLKPTTPLFTLEIYKLTSWLELLPVEEFKLQREGSNAIFQQIRTLSASILQPLHNLESLLDVLELDLQPSQILLISHLLGDFPDLLEDSPH